MAKNQFFNWEKVENCQKMQFHKKFYLIFMENIKKIFREFDLFDFTSFLGWDFLKFSGPNCEFNT